MASQAVFAYNANTVFLRRMAITGASRESVMKLAEPTHPNAWKPNETPPHSVLSVRRRTQHDAFGHITDEQNLANPTAEPADHIFGFTGRERDEESDLNYYRARYYDPSTGQFISQDPIGFEAGDANLYRYVGNGPTNATDPSGHVGIKIGANKDIASTTVRDATGNTWIVSAKYEGARRRSGFMDTSGAKKRLHSAFMLRVKFIPANPMKAICRVNLAAAKEVDNLPSLGQVGKLVTTIGNRQWMMMVENTPRRRVTADTDYFLGITPEQAEEGTIGHLQSLKSDDYSIFPKGRHVLDAFDHAWMKWEFAQDQFATPADREYVIGAYDGTSWLGFLPFRVRFTPNAGNPQKFDMSVGVRTPVSSSATFNKARQQFWTVVQPKRDNREWCNKWLP